MQTDRGGLPAITYKTEFLVVWLTLTQYVIVQYSIVQYGIVWCSAMQCSAVQCSAVQCSAVQCSAVQCSAVQCSAVQCSAAQCSAAQCNLLQFEQHSKIPHDHIVQCIIVWDSNPCSLQSLREDNMSDYFNFYICHGSPRRPPGGLLSYHFIWFQQHNLQLGILLQ